jgi:hypothetical protein
MRALLLAALVLTATVLVPAAAAAPPEPPGGKCHVVEEYVTEAHTSGSLLDGTFRVQPGAPRPIECYY